MVAKQGQSKQSDKARFAIGDRRFSYFDHAELRRKANRSALLAEARCLLDQPGMSRHAADEAVLFKAMHAATWELHAKMKRGGVSFGTESDNLVGLLDDIRDNLFRRNIGLVYDMRRRSAVRGVDSNDLFSEGQWTLFRAIESFNPWRGFRFSTYACRSILHALHYVSTKRQRDLERVNGLRERSDTREFDLSACGARKSLDVDLSVERVRRVLTENEANLTTTERLIIHERILKRGEQRPATLESIGKLVNLSKERVRQLQITAIEKLRSVLTNGTNTSSERRTNRLEGIAA